jgi:hypothetical protein
MGFGHVVSAKRFPGTALTKAPKNMAAMSMVGQKNYGIAGMNNLSIS